MIPQITGSGTLTVTSGPSGFCTWINGTFTNGPTIPAAQRGPNDDPDHDGISNLLEYALANQDPTVANRFVSTLTSNTLTFTKRPATNGVTYAIQDSTDLGATAPWTTVSGVTYVNTSSTIYFTFPPGTLGKYFLRLKVLSN